MDMTLEEKPLDSPHDWVAEHAQRYLETDGEDGYLWNGAPTLVLTTIGRRSGKPRRTMLIFGRDGDRYVVVASQGGADQDPLWYSNMLANPEVQVQVKGERFRAHARPATPEEKPRLWKMMAAIWPAYDRYQTKTERAIPVVILEPIGAAADNH
jgi:deazaflavin-dependent oxidoreductase (nitroreductase family)